MNQADQPQVTAERPDWSSQWEFVNAIDHALVGVATNELDSEPLLSLEACAKLVGDNSHEVDDIRTAQLLFNPASKDRLPQPKLGTSFLRRVVNNIANHTSGRIEKAKYADRDDRVAREAAIGATLFGPVPEGDTREFYYLGNRVWVWNETTQDVLSSTETTRRTRYEIKPDIIVKIQDGQPPTYASLEESRNLATATKQYPDLIRKHIYSSNIAA